MFTRILTVTRPNTSVMFLDEIYDNILNKNLFHIIENLIDSGKITTTISTSSDMLSRTYTFKIKSLDALTEYRNKWAEEGIATTDTIGKYFNDNGINATVSFPSTLEEDWWTAPGLVKLPVDFWN